MTEDATLDEFFGPTDDEDGHEDGKDDRSYGSVIPFSPTYQWTPRGEKCTRCETVVERRWVREVDGNRERTELGFVCRNCKQW